MKLSPEKQSDLLALAMSYRVPTAAAQLPEEKELEELRKQQSQERSAVSSARMAVDDMEMEIRRIQEDERKLRRRLRDDERSLSAEVDPERRRDLEHDRLSAANRIEDLAGELMEAHNQIAALRTNVDVHGAKVDELTRKVEAAERALDAARAGQTAAHDESHTEELRATLPADVLAEFDSSRTENGTGAAAFNGRSCGGCYMLVPVADRSEIAQAPADEVPQCPNCGTYLVRKAA